MHLKTVFIRFYKSFNFDYLRKFNDSVTNKFPWEDMNGLWYPYVRIPIDSKITTVVGANESGKTHLLTAIEKGIRGIGIERQDFCRHSKFFTVEQGKMRWPDFGFEWTGITTEEREKIAKFFGDSAPSAFESFLFFRTNKDTLTAFLSNGSEFAKKDIDASQLSSFIPNNIFRLHEDVALPESAAIRSLAAIATAQTQLERVSRKGRVELFENVLKNHTWFKSTETVTTSAAVIAGLFSGMQGDDTPVAGTADAKKAAELKLASDLLQKVAKIDAKALQELFEALRDGKDAFANSIIDAINGALEKALNFPAWWVQDRKFRLLVSPRDYDLVFTIRDRTGQEYSFGERSSGLKYFLSYYIQYRAHEATGGQPEILLMDEPDAYLSSQGQQDLLKIFDAFANPEGDKHKRPRTQVIYVTHSPFLIDKNHGERIRVLEKGVGEEGTRVVRDASRNHYEPLRSAFGSFVAETTFIGHCNLMVEGPADQILLAGAASLLRDRGASDLETLDLNKITIVPAGGGGNIPYMAYLARGRDVEKPAVIVFVDSDTSGNEAKKGLQRGGAKHRQVVKPEYVLQVGDLSREPNALKNVAGRGLIEVEDLIPLPIACEAARRYLRDFCDMPHEVSKVSPQAITEKCGSDDSIFNAIEKLFVAISSDLHVEKVGFARTTLEVITEWARIGDAKSEELQAMQQFETNMKLLFRKLRHMQRDAERELTTDRVSRRVDRAKQSFLQDHPAEARREHAFLLLEEMEAALDESREGDFIRTEISALRRDFKISEDVTHVIPDYDAFKDRLEKLQYAGRLATQEPERPSVASLAGDRTTDTNVGTNAEQPDDASASDKKQ